MNSQFNIIICSNSETSVKKTMEFLIEKKYEIELVKTDIQLHNLIQTKNIDLIIIELDFKSKDGISMTSEIRNLKNIEQPHIILFSDKQDDYIQITAFNAGADDFIISPIKPILMEARIATFKKRTQNKPKIAVNTSTSNLIIDKEQYIIITKNGKISLPKKEFEMLSLMRINSNKTFTRKDFANLIWNSLEVANSRIIDIHISNIRRVLGYNIIKTIKGIGYSINQELL